MQHLALVSGSLRTESLNTKLLRAFADSVPSTIDVSWGNLDLPLFNEDLETKGLPPEVTAFKEVIDLADGVIIASPEYNRGMSGVLKNAIDWASRPNGLNSFLGKPVMIVTASPGRISGALAYYQVVQSLTHLGAVVSTDQEFMLGGAKDKFSEAGLLQDETTADHIKSALDNFLQ